MAEDELAMNRLSPAQVAQHAFIDAKDEIYSIHDYHPGLGRRGGAGNALILDFKTDINGARLAHWLDRKKWQATKTLAATVRAARPETWRQDTCIVPTPPSGPRDHPDYDGRLTNLLALAKLPFADCVTLTAFHTPLHGQSDRPTPEALALAYRFDRRSGPRRPPQRLVIFDDVLTTGRHFPAMCLVLQTRFPNAAIVGVFLARRRIVDE
jgi:predicted amidophosphoribosyltransferase